MFRIFLLYLLHKSDKWKTAGITRIAQSCAVDPGMGCLPCQAVAYRGYAF